MKTILVPLDGSSLAEQAIPLAQAIAERGRCKLKLVLVHQPNLFAVPGPAYPKVELAMQKADREYLKIVTSRLRDRLGRSVSSAVIQGTSVAQTLAEYVSELGADLVVMTTHGRGGIRRAWLGSVTDQLIRRLEVPLIAVRATEPTEQPRPVSINEILVPLDGSELAEAALEPAAAIARLWDAEVSLVQIVYPVSLAFDAPLSFPTPVDSELTEMRRNAAEDYVRDLARRLREQGIRASGIAVMGGSAAGALLDLARPEKVGLLAMTTHGRGGITRALLGSVADKLVRAAEVPVLVVRPIGSHARRKSGERHAEIGAGASA